MDKDELNKLTSEKSPETRNKVLRLHYYETNDWKLGVQPKVKLPRLDLQKMKVLCYKD